MPKFIYDGAGHTLVIAGQPLQRGIPTELTGRAAEAAAQHPDIHEAGKKESTPAASAAPAWGTTVKDALAWVGDDRERAAEVLAAEQARGDEARTTLVTGLEAMLAEPAPAAAPEDGAG